ncbi:bifunctional DNA-formamidopyrimidine glycosylase/DNA-(apurinic or apyrimidinic site) lyase [Arthrobacter sp. NamB2]|uniref:bifunctional DNA-formamidopyrimidine glycosylase/DNA-(apurinic or apyrimidinic site) lyase n=1 Tax=Arthrobacter sp. NamB2 TaxID=2576035 RepID=UPI0010C9754F|nr:bifunctional DNA-formamidopyrimidine glycosylase/DNA-(apurinic or apyrimidinic site) lyase [Arthrobacter sp. NamB2]TKV29901.1 bifunctional DNA-formamidopyrimidine glycosylase/DNA-(apurinic or apyrimidinic site) lyase [Arthrobacter sp. NamB2]
MPELPEVEVVRRGLVRWAAGRSIEAVDVLDPRSLRRHVLGAEDFVGNLTGARIRDVVRRGKFLWMTLEDPTRPHPQPRDALMSHLGMSGQLLIEEPDAPTEKHLKVRLRLSAAFDEEGGRLPTELRFVDQRIFGGMFVTDLEPTADGQPGGLGVENLALIPRQAAHIARDPLDPAFSVESFHRRLRERRTGLKRALLDQGLISGIGNIYADEALWLAKMHYARPTDTMRRPDTVRIIDAVTAVMERALDAGGTSFDSLYVNVNGASGYFARELEAYGRAGHYCRRCLDEGRQTAMRRESFMNRSSFLCPFCQPRPRNARM